ncbi:MAG TPA: very short patch repair endonuclease [Anaerolineae bacterium]|nr:very short patch repair endonuclease [Anaerolineae bacterium]
MNPECPTTPERSRIMAAIPSRDTKPEVTLRRACWRMGLRYRKHRRDLPGTPDFAFASARVAVFVDGDFWHGRAFFGEGKCPANNREYWAAKFLRNRERDLTADGALRAMGWLPLRVWESDISARLPACARLVRVAVRLRERRRDA